MADKGILDKIMDTAKKFGDAAVTAPSTPSGEGASIKAKSDAINQYRDAVAAKPVQPKAPTPTSNVDKVNSGSKFGTRPGEKRPGPDGLPQYHKGTTNVPNTGKAVLKKGEAVIPAHENPMNPDNMYKMLPGMADRKAPKELDHMRIRKAKSGGHIVEHHFSAPGDHKMEEHIMPDMAAMHAHMDENLAPEQGDPAAAA